jgi:hypothetical protein
MASASLSAALSASLPVGGPVGDRLGVARGVGAVGAVDSADVISTDPRALARPCTTLRKKRRWRRAAPPGSPTMWPPGGWRSPLKRATSRSRRRPPVVVAPGRLRWDWRWSFRSSRMSACWRPARSRWTVRGHARRAARRRPSEQPRPAALGRRLWRRRRRPHCRAAPGPRALAALRPEGAWAGTCCRRTRPTRAQRERHHRRAHPAC